MGTYAKYAVNADGNPHQFGLGALIRSFYMLNLTDVNFIVTDDSGSSQTCAHGSALSVAVSASQHITAQAVSAATTGSADLTVYDTPENPYASTSQSQTTENNTGYLTGPQTVTPIALTVPAAGPVTQDIVLAHPVNIFYVAPSALSGTNGFLSVAGVIGSTTIIWLSRLPFSGVAINAVAPEIPFPYGLPKGALIRLTAEFVGFVLGGEARY